MKTEVRGHLIGIAVLALVFLTGPLARAFPIITNVVETGGDNEATDTIVAKWTGQTWRVTVAGEPVAGLAVGDVYTAGTFGSGAPAFVDRAHRYLDDVMNALPVPAYLVGRDYIMSGQDNRDNASYRLDVSIVTPAIAYLLIDNRLSDHDSSTPPTFDATHMQWVLDQGWYPMCTGANRNGDASKPDEVGIDDSSSWRINNWYSVYVKSHPAGTFSLLQADNDGQNMYGIVVAAVREVGPEVDIGLRMFDGTSTNRIACQLPGPDGILVSPLRIAKNGTNYGIMLVETTSTNASKILIKTSEGIKAWRKLPPGP